MAEDVELGGILREQSLIGADRLGYAMAFLQGHGIASASRSILGIGRDRPGFAFQRLSGMIQVGQGRTVAVPGLGRPWIKHDRLPVAFDRLLEPAGGTEYGGQLVPDRGVFWFEAECGSQVALGSHGVAQGQPGNAQAGGSHGRPGIDPQRAVIKGCGARGITLQEGDISAEVPGVEIARSVGPELRENCSGLSQPAALLQ